MSKGSALVSILFAFLAGVLIGNITAGPTAPTEETAVAGAAEGDEGDVKAAEADGIDRYKVPVTAAQPVKGPADAPITIVQWSDFQCPFCSRVEPTIDQLMKDYPNKVRVVWRNNPLPFHNNAMPAAIVAMEAFAQGGSDKFWKMHNKLFENQKALAREDLEKYAGEVGLDAAKVKAALDGNKYKDGISADQELGGKLGANGTPAFFINGRFLSGAQPLPKFKEIIDDELKRADKLVQTGTPKNKVYAALTKNGLTAAKAAAAAPDAPKPRQPDPKAVYKVEVAPGNPVKGPNDALVTIVQFSDFQCPFCKRVEPTVDQIMQTYGKDVRVVWKNNPLPFHNNAGPAANAAMAAAEQGKFWEYHNKLFENQQALAPENLEQYAKDIGVNVAKWKASFAAPDKFKAAIDADQGQARALGASGTPSFFINGRSLRGAQPFEAFKAVIDEELQKAKDLVAKGTPRAQVYAKLTANGATTQQFVDGPAPNAPSAAPDADKIYQIPVATDAPSKGKKGAKVLIQMFSDFQCPFCSRVEPTVKQIMDEYGDKVQIVWRNYPLPFHDKAQKAAEAAVEAYEQGGSEKFWAYHDTLFANQQALTPEDLIKHAQAVGLNTQKLKAALDSDKHKARVQADQDAITKAGARIGTPSFFINGKLLQGAQPYPAFKAAIDAALAAK